MDALSKQISKKVSLLRTFVERVKDDIVGKPFISQLDVIHTKITEIELRHMLSTSHLFAMEESIKTKSDYLRVISDECILDHLNWEANACSKIMDRLPRETTKTLRLKYLIDTFYSNLHINVNNNVKVVNYTLCDFCNVPMNHDYDNAELQCSECGITRRLVGTIYSDSINASHDKIKNRNGVFNPNRHFKQWWQRILAREPDEEIGDPNDPQNQHGEKIIIMLRKIVSRSNKPLQHLDVHDVRLMLKEIKKTKYNRNVPLIMKKLTGIGPPNVSDELSQRVEKLFTKAIEIGEQKSRDGRINRNYYPYYIYKIIDAIVPESEFETRRILYYIYLQSDSTVVNDDKDWEEICKSLPEIKFSVTDKTKYLRYRPE